MLICFPFSSLDRAQLASLLHLIDDFCGPQPFHCLLACEEGLETDEIKSLAAKLFKSASVQHVRTLANSWPSAPNGYFQQVAEAVASNTSEPWFWHEADLMPLIPSYLLDIFSDYTRHGKRFYGPVCGTYQRRDQNNHAAGFIQTSEHLIGTAIYPADYFHSVDGFYDERKEPVQPSLVRYIWANAEESLRLGQHVVPFDVFLEAETTPRAHRSTIMQHCWRSRNYREANGRIEFDVDVNYGQDTFLRSGVVVAHGGKDDSLLRIVRRRAGLDGIPEIGQSSISGVEQVAARQAHNLEAEGASPSPATTLNNQPGGDGASPSEFAGSRSVKKHPESPGAEEQKPALPPEITAIELVPMGAVVTFKNGVKQAVAPERIVPLKMNPAWINATHEVGPSGLPELRPPPRRRGKGKRMKKSPRTPEQQRVINDRMAAMRAKRVAKKAHQQEAARTHH